MNIFDILLYLSHCFTSAPAFLNGWSAGSRHDLLLHRPSTAKLIRGESSTIYPSDKLHILQVDSVPDGFYTLVIDRYSGLNLLQCKAHSSRKCTIKVHNSSFTCEWASTLSSQIIQIKSHFLNLLLVYWWYPMVIMITCITLFAWYFKECYGMHPKTCNEIILINGSTL